MKKTICVLFIFVLALLFNNELFSQTQTAVQFSGKDCNGVSQDLYADLDAGYIVFLHFFMPNCTMCPPSAKTLQSFGTNLMKNSSAKIKGYAMPFSQTDCVNTSTWVSSNGLSLYTPYGSGASQLPSYGGFGMPTVVVVGGKDHRVLYSSLSFSKKDTLMIRDSIYKVLNIKAGVEDNNDLVNSFNVFPNPASNLVTINLELKKTSDINIEIIDITGKQVALVMNEKQLSGIISRNYNISNLSDGNYLIRLNIDNKSFTQKLNIVK